MINRIPEPGKLNPKYWRGEKGTIATNVTYLQIVLHNEIDNPIYLDVPIPPELREAIRMSRITKVDFKVYDKFQIPSAMPSTEINKLKTNLG